MIFPVAQLHGNSWIYCSQNNNDDGIQDWSDNRYDCYMWVLDVDNNFCVNEGDNNDSYEGCDCRELKQYSSYVSINEWSFLYYSKLRVCDMLSIKFFSFLITTLATLHTPQLSNFTFPSLPHFHHYSGPHRYNNAIDDIKRIVGWSQSFRGLKEDYNLIEEEDQAWNSRYHQPTSVKY